MAVFSTQYSSPKAYSVRAYLQVIAVMIVLNVSHAMAESMEQSIGFFRRQTFKEGIRSRHVGVGAGPPSPPGECNPTAPVVCSNHG